MWVLVDASAFVLSLLEPDPEKRPSVRAAMEEKWINEGYAKRPLHMQAHKNRYRTTEKFLFNLPSYGYYRRKKETCIFKVQGFALNLMNPMNPP